MNVNPEDVFKSFSVVARELFTESMKFAATVPKLLRTANQAHNEVKLLVEGAATSASDPDHRAFISEVERLHDNSFAHLIVLTERVARMATETAEPRAKIAERTQIVGKQLEAAEALQLSPEDRKGAAVVFADAKTAQLCSLPMLYFYMGISVAPLETIFYEYITGCEAFLKRKIGSEQLGQRLGTLVGPAMEDASSLIVALMFDIPFLAAIRKLIGEINTPQIQNDLDAMHSAASIMDRVYKLRTFNSRFVAKAGALDQLNIVYRQGIDSEVARLEQATTSVGAFLDRLQ
jgi:hypothetical protein